MNRRNILVLAAFVMAIAGFAVGLRGAPGAPAKPVVDVPVAYAIDCQAPNDTCGQDTTKTSFLEVDHRSGTPPGSLTVVTPNTGESWEFDVLWVKDTPCQGYSTTESGSFDVDWTGSGWALSNVSLPGHVRNISICDTSGGCASTNPSRSYKVILDIDDNIYYPPSRYDNLQEVTYSTTSVDNGLRFTNLLCSTTTAVSPTSQSWSDVDNAGDWGLRCAFNCSVGGGGASVTITYN